ncbi:glycine C-acetyltransferase [Emcibacter nanhaiensis]|uniref:2-amino-3-ketobutyrate coenzyme A ligase n=1 Tax=Emcibacter nanhaiensis TaxID=1505037 RepID=A0A501PM06_9PROT|nr:glycine C-acetyltransferase [Emcibacter nanhaiensis]TPD61540.1 glycine C-acetyltransferase [Emcibacter nanhaiensis]
MSRRYIDHLTSEIAALKEAGLYKSERTITSPQQAVVHVAQKGDQDFINFCANNYLGLANDPQLVEAAKTALDKYGYGMSSVRFICGTQDIHKELEHKLAAFLGTEDVILYPSCFDANAGLFETLLTEEDAIISDALNHASIIDGIRLCKAKRFRYANNDMQALEDCLKQAQDCRFRLIATDGVFSMDGILANLPAICDLAEKYDAMVMVDDSHAVGFMGESGAGTPEYFGLSDRVDILTGTLGKAMGGASGGYTAADAVIVDWLRQRSRPYLFSNTLAPVIAATSCTVIDMLKESGDLRAKVHANAARFREKMEQAGFSLGGAGHPIVPVMLGDARLAGEMADRLLEEGIFVIGFSYPVVPEGKARIRTQMSAAHTTEQIDRAVNAFSRIGRELGVI